MTAQGTTQVENRKVNGVNVGQVMEIIGSVQDKPENAQFQFRLNNRWIDGGLNDHRRRGQCPQPDGVRPAFPGGLPDVHPDLPRGGAGNRDRIG